MRYLSTTLVLKLCSILPLVEGSFHMLPHQRVGGIHNKLSNKFNKCTSLNKNENCLFPLGDKSVLQRRKKTELEALSNIKPSTVPNPYVSTYLHTSLIATSVILLVVYHLNLFRKEKSKQSWRIYQANNREQWAQYVRDTEGWLYAIQSLRNAITAQTFLASTVLSLLTLITGKLWDMIRTTVNKYERRLLVVQTLSIAVTMLSSAYQFLQGVRLMTHVGFMFPVVKKEDSKVNKLMRKTEIAQWLGLRWFYISIALIFWTVGGSRAFCLSSILLTSFFRIIDKVPDDQEGDKQAIACYTVPNGSVLQLNT